MAKVILKKIKANKNIIWITVGILIIILTVVVLAFTTRKKNAIVFDNNGVKIVESHDVVDTADTSDILGNVSFNGQIFKTFSKPEEAFAYTKEHRNYLFSSIETMANCNIEAIDFDGKADRISITVIWVDDQLISSRPCGKVNRNNWAGTIDISQYAGHQIVVMIHSEMGIHSSFQYVSFFLPEIETAETENN